MKKITALFLAFLMVFSMTPAMLLPSLAAEKEGTFYHWGNIDFEASSTLGNNLLLGIAVSDGATKEALIGAPTKVTIDGVTKETTVKSEIGTFSRSGVSVYFFRIEYNPFPARGTYDATVEIAGKTGTTFTGVVSVNSDAINLSEYPETPIATTLDKYGSCWEDGMLLVTMNNLLHTADLADPSVDVYVDIDGTEYHNAYASKYDWNATSALLRLKTMTYDFKEHTVQVKAKSGDKILYESTPLTIPKGAMGISGSGFKFWSTASQFEANENGFGKTLILGMPANYGVTEALLKDAKVKITLGGAGSNPDSKYDGKVYNTTVASSFSTGTIFARIAFNPLLDKGTYKNVSVQITGEDGTALVSADLVTLKSNGEDGLYPHDATATRYLSGDTDWENGLLLINLTKLWDKTDFSQEGVTVDVLFDGKNYENVLESTAGFASTRGRLILRLGIDEPEAGEYTAKVTVKKNGEVLYNTNEITVKSDKVVDTDVALSVVAPTEAKKPGETFTVDVKASGIPEKGMNGWQYGLTYNKEAFELVSVEHCPDAAVTPYGFTSDNETTYGAPLAVGCALGEGDVMTGDAVLERITFKVKDGAVPNAYTIEIVECSAEKGGNSFYYMENADADVVTADYEPTYTAGTVTVEEAEVLPLTVEATTDAADVKPGDTVTVTYTLKNPSKAPVAGYRFHITNSTGLTLNGVTVPATLGGVATVDQTEGGAVVVSLADGATFTDEEIVIATAAFTANADAAGEQTFGAELTDADSVYGPAPAERKYETTATGGSVTLPELEPLTATLTLSKNTVKPGETFTASVKLTNLPATGVGGWDLTLNLPDSLEIVSLENPTIEGGKILGVLNKAEKRIMGTVSGSGDVGVLNLTEDTEIAIITLKASETVSDKVTGQITLTANDVYYCDPDAADGVTEISVDAPEAVSADVTVKPVGEAKFTVSSVTGDTGDTVDVTISITENPGLVSALLKVKYGEGLTLTKVTNGSVFTAENGFTTAHSDAADDLANNPYTLSWEGDLLREDFTGTGDIVTLSFKIPDDAELNEENPTAYAITVETADSELVNTDLAVVPSTAEAGSVTVVCPKIDADGEWATDENGNHYHEDAHGHIFDVGAHEGGTATCLKKAVCEICGKEYGELTAHKGGTATCQKKAECEVCGEEYGELGAHTLEKVPAKDPTKTEDGNLEHYRCTVCGKLFGDAEATEEKTADDVRIPALGYIFGDVNDDGVVDELDRIALSRYLAQWKEQLEKGIDMYQSDVNMDGKVNTLDRIILSRHLEQWEGYETLPKKEEEV